MDLMEALGSLNCDFWTFRSVVYGLNFKLFSSFLMGYMGLVLSFFFFFLPCYVIALIFFLLAYFSISFPLLGCSSSSPQEGIMSLK